MAKEKHKTIDLYQAIGPEIAQALTRNLGSRITEELANGMLTTLAQTIDRAGLTLVIPAPKEEKNDHNGHTPENKPARA